MQKYVCMHDWTWRFRTAWSSEWVLFLWVEPYLLFLLFKTNVKGKRQTVVHLWNVAPGKHMALQLFPGPKGGAKQNQMRRWLDQPGQIGLDKDVCVWMSVCMYGHIGKAIVFTSQATPLHKDYWTQTCNKLLTIYKHTQRWWKMTGTWKHNLKHVS